jgi:hypothetical protein
VSEALDRFFLFDPELKSTILTYIEYTVDQQARQFLWEMKISAV